MGAKKNGPWLLVADDDPITLQVIQYGFLSRGWEGEYFSSAENLLEAVGATVQVCILDLKMPGIDGLECLARLRESNPSIKIIMLTSVNEAAEALKANELGAFDYVTKPFEIDKLVNSVSKARELAQSQAENSIFKGAFAEPTVSLRPLGNSEAIFRVTELIKKVAQTNNTVLFTGESGTGKTLLARVLHANSTRSSAPFVSISCPSLPGELLESELFGHEKGAYTGADSKRVGRVHMAESGTLFLDEIGDLSLGLQSKLLTFLQEKRYYRVGGDEPIESDVRIIAATNRDLSRLVEEGRFRQDLYYRLNVLPVRVPRLEDRLEDIPDIVQHILAQYASDNNQSIPRVTSGYLNALKASEWPGNVRQLENTVIRSLTFRKHDGSLEASDLGTSVPETVMPSEDHAGDFTLAGMSLEEIERKALIDTLLFCGKSKSKAALLLGVSEKTIYNKLKRYGIIVS